jgi:hypothetical protein
MEGLKAFAVMVDDEKVDIVDTLIKKSRLLVSIMITIKDDNQQTTMTGQFDWFLQLTQTES